MVTKPLTIPEYRAVVRELELSRVRRDQETRRTGGRHPNERRNYLAPGKGHRQDWKKEL